MIRRGFYAILDLDHLAGREPTGLAVELLDGGCVALQLRAKSTASPPGRLLPLARRLVSLAHRYRVPFIVNDHVPLAAMAGADAVHLGQDDLEPREARLRLHPKQRIGLSTHTPEQARAAAELAASDPTLNIAYLGYGPVRATRTKQAPDEVQGFEGLADACAQVALPVVAIGGLTLQDAEATARAGATALAAISAVLGAENVEETARRLHTQFRSDTPHGG